MSQAVYGNINSDGTQEMDRGNRRNHTGSDCVKIRSSRSAAVCLALLCVLLLTAVIVLCVHIHTMSTNYTQETRQLLTNITNLAEEKDKLLSMITNLTEERDGLKIKTKNLTNERDKLLNKDITLTNERDGLTKNNYQTNERDQFNQEKNELWKMLKETDGYIYQSSFYYMSSEKKSWSESRRYCTEKGADLIIINNKEKQEFVQKIFGNAGVWIGLTDSDVEGTWKWVDGSTLTSGFWAIREPNGYQKENCAALYSLGFYDYPCNSAFKWICNDTTIRGLSKMEGFLFPSPCPSASPMAGRRRKLLSLRQEGTSVKEFAHRFVFAAEGLNISGTELKYIFNNGLNEPFSLAAVSTASQPRRELILGEHQASGSCLDCSTITGNRRDVSFL
ncbi:CD209 antigen-like protein B [Pseudorasbora parva]|uniref:CD209 antigen-like protein B n=1 Tax=Pseudorasbora parva TaxID=51549 RepID=UPI00351ED279